MSTDEAPDSSGSNNTPPAPQAHDRHLHLSPRAATTLAHPLRSRILSALRVGGPASATDLARALETNTGATSYHLRRLAGVDLVEDTGNGRGKERLWQASSASHGWRSSDFDADPDAAAAVDWLVRTYHRQFDAAYGRWLDAAEAWPARWRDAMGMNDRWVEVTAEEAGELARRIDELVEGFAAEARGRDTPDTRREVRRVQTYSVLFPLDLEDAPPADPPPADPTPADPTPDDPPAAP